MRVLIYGAGKTGTTAIFFACKNAFADIASVFEPEDLNAIEYENYENIIVKSLIVNKHEKQSTSFKFFDKKILVIRHPFDRLVSYALYIPNNGHGFLDDRKLSNYISLIKKKIDQPGDVSFREIAEVADQYLPLKNILHDSVNVLMTINRTYSDFFIFKYEDFIDGKVNELEAYIGLPIKTNPKLDESVVKVSRSKKYGDWHKWFLKEDIEYYKNIYREYMECFNYSAISESSHPLDIDTTIKYTIKVANYGRRDRWLPEYIHGKINMTDEGQICQYAMRALNQGDVDKASIIINRLSKREIDIPAYYYIRSKIYFLSGDYRLALKNIERAISIAPSENIFSDLRSEIMDFI